MLYFPMDPGVVVQTYFLKQGKATHSTSVHVAHAKSLLTVENWKEKFCQNFPIKKDAQKFMCI